MVLLRHEIGDVLREQRQSQGRTLRQVSGAARVSLGYLSEVEGDAAIFVADQFFDHAEVIGLYMAGHVQNRPIIIAVKPFDLASHDPISHQLILMILTKCKPHAV